MKKTVKRIAMLIAIMLFITTGCYSGVKSGEGKSRRYRDGLLFIELASYDAAEGIFAELGNFKESDYLESFCAAASCYDTEDNSTYSVAYSKITRIPDSYSGVMNSEIKELKSDITKRYRNYMNEKITEEEKEKSERMILSMITSVL